MNLLGYNKIINIIKLKRLVTYNLIKLDLI